MNAPIQFDGSRLDGPVAVLGHGVSGRAAATLLRGRGYDPVIYDQREGSGLQRDLTVAEARRYRLVVTSPGFSPQHPWVRAAVEAGCRVLGELDLAWELWRLGAPEVEPTLLAITGTNGKTTLTEFLALALSAAGIEARAVGNNGIPLSTLVDQGPPYPVAVCEISSFQAEVLELIRPKAVLWPQFAEDHLDRHGSLRAYFLAKWRLVELLQGTRLVVGKSVRDHAETLGCPLPPWAVVVEGGSTLSAAPEGSVFAGMPQSDNYAVAKAYWELEGHPMGVLEQTARRFVLAPHRLSLVATLDGVRYWNDSKATNFSAVEGALERFNGPLIWIGGGRAKGGDLAAFARVLAPRLAGALLIGETGPEMVTHLQSLGVAARVYPDLVTAVRASRLMAGRSADVLFSPGFASFDQFGDYAERGRCFESAVLGLKNEEAHLTTSPCTDSQPTSS